MSEVELVKQAKKGDDDAFYQLIVNHKNQLYRMALTYLKNEGEAVEAIQEVTFRAYKKLKKLRQPELFKTWLIRILINYCHDEWKRKKRFSLIDKNDIEVVNDNGEVPGIDNETKLSLKESLNKIKPHYRDVVILKFFEDLTVGQISEILEKPEGTVKTWLRRALKELKVVITEEDINV